MKRLILLFIAIFAIYFVFAQSKIWVNGYRKSNGTYVEGHYRSSANSTNHDNWSTKGNTNPSTSSKGYRAPDYSRQATNYGAGRTIQTGPKGGQYYRNPNGNKVYVPKQPTTTYPTTTYIRTKQTGPKGGKYYRNSSGNKVYVPKRPTTTYPTATYILTK